MKARVFEAVDHPEMGPAVRRALDQLLQVLDATAADGVILDQGSKESTRSA
jgi:hypothetical protein